MAVSAQASRLRSGRGGIAVSDGSDSECERGRSWFGEAMFGLLR